MSKILNSLNKAKQQKQDEVHQKELSAETDEKDVSLKIKKAINISTNQGPTPIVILVVLIAFMSAGSLVISLKTMQDIRQERAASTNLIQGYFTEKSNLEKDIQQLKVDLQQSNEKITNELRNLINHTGLTEKVIEKAIAGHEILKMSFEDLKSTDRLLLDKYILLKQKVFGSQENSNEEGRK